MAVNEEGAQRSMPHSPSFVLRAKGLDKYPAKSHAERVADKLGVQEGLVMLKGSITETYPESDVLRPFRQDRDFFYLTGCNEPGCYVTYNISKDKLVLWLPSIDKARVVWTGRGSTVEEAMEKYDVDDARYIQVRSKKQMLTGVSLDRVLDDIIFNSRSAPEIPDNVYCLVKRYAKRGIGEATNASDLKQAINACRVLKDEHEISLIKQANEISAKAHLTVLESLHAFTNEAQVEAAYTSVCIANLAREQAYAPIAGSGINGGELHYVDNTAEFGDSQSMVLDAGCEVSCYASDVTRSFPLNAKKPGHWQSGEAEDIYRLVEKMQETCIRQMKPGNDFADIGRLAQHIAIDGLLKLGVLKGEREDIFRAGTDRGFFPHGLGHHVGLEVHDVAPQALPDLSVGDSITPRDQLMLSLPTRNNPFHFATALSFTSTPMEPGMVITVEPGIYFNSFLLENFFLNDPKHKKFIDEDVLKRYMKVGGVRIEDDILITRTGRENLTTAPKGQRMLEIIRSSAKKNDRRKN